jgi:hypothetical protein
MNDSKAVVKLMNVGDSKKVADGKYTLKRVGNQEYSCTCFGWKMQKVIPRKCKHVDAYLQEAAALFGVAA